MNKRLKLLRSMLVIGLVAFGVPLVTMSAASAHTPNLTKSCAGITVSGTSYESVNTNTLGIRIDGGAWTTKTFAVSDSLTVSVPQDGLVHSYNAYVHTTNANTAYSRDYSGTVGPCGNLHVTAVLWDKTDPTCAADGALVVQSEPAGITVGVSPAATGPGHYTITFTPQAGYAIDGATSQTIDVLPQLTGDQCASIVQPVEPMITDPSCTGPGTGTAGSITLPADGGGISYTKIGDVVTATADATHKFVTVPSGWVLVDSHHATYTASFSSPEGYPECVVQVLTPVPPTASAPTCDTDGDLVVGTTANVVTRVDGSIVTEETHYGPGTHELGYTAASGYVFEGGTTSSSLVEVKGMTLDCPATPASPSVTQSVCNGPGTHTEPVVQPGETADDHITYVYDAVNHVVTATPDAGFALVGLPSGWVLGDGSATYVVELIDPGPCLVEVAVPVAPVPTGPTCSVDGALTVSPTEHVVTTVDNTLVSEETAFGPGEHTLAYAPVPGYAFDGEVVTSTAVTVLPSTKDCPAEVVPPTVTRSVCTGPGTKSDPVVTPGDFEGDHVSYAYDSTLHLVTATPDEGFLLANLDAAWVALENGSATYAVSLTDPGSCEVTVLPPIVSPPTVQPPPTVIPPSSLPDTGAGADLGVLAGLGVLLILLGTVLLRKGRARRTLSSSVTG